MARAHQGAPHAYELTDCGRVADREALREFGEPGDHVVRDPFVDEHPLHRDADLSRVVEAPLREQLERRLDLHAHAAQLRDPRVAQELDRAISDPGRVVP